MSSRERVGDVRENALSSEEEDMLARSVKKAKATVTAEEMVVDDTDLANKDLISPEKGVSSMEDEVLVEESVLLEDREEEKGENRKKMSYLDSLLGFNGGEDWSDRDPIDNIEDEELEEDEESWEDDVEEDVYCPPMDVSAEERKKYCLPWRQSLIVKILGKSFGVGFIRIRLERLWARNGGIHLVDLENGYFLVKFEDKKDFLYAFHEGPWMIAEHYLLVQRWRPDFDAYNEEFRKVAVWIRVPGLPIEYYNRSFLWRVGNRVGRSLKVDTKTLSSLHDDNATVGRGRFARLCVEVDLRKKLLSKFRLRGRKYSVEYEGLHFVCFDCGRFGHRKDNCPEAVMEVKEGPEMPNLEGKEMIHHRREVGKEAFGPWMMVQKSSRMRRGGSNNFRGMASGGDKMLGEKVKPQRETMMMHGGGSRFESIANMEEDTVMVENQTESGGKGNEITIPVEKKGQEKVFVDVEIVNGGKPEVVQKENEKKKKGVKAVEGKENKAPMDSRGLESQKQENGSNSRDKGNERTPLRKMEGSSKWGKESKGQQVDPKEARSTGNDLRQGTIKVIDSKQKEVSKPPKPPDPKEGEDLIRSMNHMLKNMSREEAVPLIGGTQVYYDLR